LISFAVRLDAVFVAKDIIKTAARIGKLRATLLQDYILDKVIVGSDKRIIINYLKYWCLSQGTDLARGYAKVMLMKIRSATSSLIST